MKVIHFMTHTQTMAILVRDTVAGAYFIRVGNGLGMCMCMALCCRRQFSSASMLLGDGRKPKNLKEPYAGMGRTDKIPHRQQPELKIKLGVFVCVCVWICVCINLL